MRKLTPQEQQWVECAYPLVKQTMESYNLSENDTIDWHGELSVALCEAAIEMIDETAHYNAPTLLIRWPMYAAVRLTDCVHKILEAKQYQIKEIPSGLRPQQAAGRGRGL